MMRPQFLTLALLIMPIIAAGSENLESYFRFMGFELEKDDLTGIQKILGTAPTHQEGDAANSYTAICYRVAGENLTVYFESGEMGGGSILLGYRVIAEDSPDFRCGSTDSRKINEYKIGVLEIGAEIEDIIESLPGEIESRDGNNIYYYKKVPFTDEEIERLEVKNMKYAFWDQSVTIQLFSAGNLVSGYRVVKVTSW